MATPSLPISEILKNKDREAPEEEEPQAKRSRQENYKKAKELEEARKAGNAPAAVDEEGRDINPHIPQYISNVPFFYNTNHPTLKHQRAYKVGQKHVPLEVDLQRGVKIQTATKYRPGACENCGAMTHKKKDCLERPRRIGAKFSNKDIAPDEVILPEIEHNFDSKRDRWAGFRPEMYKQTIEEFNKVEEAKRKLKEETLQKEADAVNRQGDVEVSSSDDDSDSDDEEKYAEKADMPGAKVDTKQRMTVRNLRMREDTAKYLLNLDPNSAYYDPKTRSMREDPIPGCSTIKGDNFVRYSGNVKQANEAQVFAWQAAEKGIDVHLQALPTKTEMLKKEYESKKTEYDEKISKYISQKYEPEKVAKHLTEELEQSETYVEYTRTGKPKGKQ